MHFEVAVTFCYINALRTGICEGNSPVTSEFPVQMVSNAENVSIWLRHHDLKFSYAYRGWTLRATYLACRLFIRFYGANLR